MALNFGLLDTSIPERIGAMPANALAMRRQRIAQDEDRAMGREQAQMQNALARMQMQRGQRDIDADEALRTAAQGGGEWSDVIDRVRGVDPMRALDLEAKVGTVQSSRAAAKAAVTKQAWDKLERYRQHGLDAVRTPQQYGAWLQQQHTDPELAPVMSMLPPLEESLRTIPSDPAQFEKFRQQGMMGMEKWLQMNKPTDFERTAQMAGLSPEQTQAAARQRLVKETTHAPGTQVIMTQEREESKAVGKGFGEQFMDIQKSGLDAGGKIARFDRLGQLLDGVSTGKLTPTTTQIAALAQSVGLNIDDKLPAKQAAEALSNEIALQLRNPSGGAGMPGALSDKDREFLVGMTPGIAKTPEGNRLIIETAKKLAKREQEVAKIAREYRKKNGGLDEGFYDELAAYSEKNPLFQAAGTPAPKQAGPAVGAVQDGYRFKGGNPADPNSWQKVQ